jgi:hypothetical protein
MNVPRTETLEKPIWGGFTILGTEPAKIPSKVVKAEPVLVQAKDTPTDYA